MGLILYTFSEILFAHRIFFVLCVIQVKRKQRGFSTLTWTYIG